MLVKFKAVMRRFPEVLLYLCVTVISLSACGKSPELVATEPRPRVVVMTPSPGGANPATFQRKVFYELWVRSFQDSDGDGIGDLRGAMQRLDELEDLGVGAVWLMPTFPSPLADSGYDVADYRGVHPDYGTLDDLRAFVTAAHQRGILVYLDMVFNHTSDQHPWFQSALSGPASPYFDYYVWASEPMTRCADVLPGPFGSNRWTFAPTAGLYYFHQFYARQPDLNFRNPIVQEELLGVLRYWMGWGIDGFRFDVPDRYFEEGDRCAHLPDTIAFHARLRETIAGGAGRLDRGFVGEIWGWNHEVKPFFGPSGDPMIFNFGFLYTLYSSIAVGEDPAPIAHALADMLAEIPSESRWGVFLGNHDTPRFADVAAGDVARIKLAAAVVLTVPAVPFIWMGDELGLRMGTQYRVDWRDGSRVPYPWSASEPGYGFSRARPHLGFAPNSRRVAYDLQRNHPESLLNTHRRLIAVRNERAALQSPHFQEVTRVAPLWVYERWEGSDHVWVVHNFARAESARWRAEAIIPPAVEDLLTGERLRSREGIWLAPSQTRILAPIR